MNYNSFPSYGGYGKADENFRRQRQEQDDEFDIIVREQGQRFRLLGFLAVVVLLSLAILFRQSHSWDINPIELSNLAKADQGFKIETYNEYTRTQPLSSKHPWTIIEPYRPTTFRVLDSRGRPLAAGDARCAFTLDGSPLTGDAGGAAAAGACAVEATVAGPAGRGAALRAVVEPRAGAAAAAVVEERVAVKYVRREFSALTPEDRARFLDALQTLYTVGWDEGRARFGPGYKPARHFALKHLAAAADRACDRWHDAPAVQTTHSAFTLELEQALQVVDPGVSVAYWDYFADIERYGADFLARSDVFAPEHLGSPTPANARHVVDAGRWAFAEVPAAEGAAERALSSPHGLLRSPWNANPAPFLTRSTDLYGRVWEGLPRCGTLGAMFATKAFGEFAWYLNGFSHGPVHIATGGAWGHPNAPLLRDLGMAGHNVLYSKHLWRMGFMRCPAAGTCTGGDDTECACSCPAEARRGLSAYQILHHETRLLNWIERYSSGAVLKSEDEKRYFLRDVPRDDEAAQAAAWEEVLAALCTPGSVGEMYTSASPLDPLFWVIHPTTERLWFWKLLNPAAAGFKDAWGYRYGTVPSDTGLVCDWAAADAQEAAWAAEGEGEGRAPRRFAAPACALGECPGHGEWDRIPFGGFRADGADAAPFAYTNREYLDFARPDELALPYTYDHFRYPYCGEGVIVADVPAPAPAEDDW